MADPPAVCARHLLHDMKTVQNVDRLRCFFRDHLQAGLPHIAADELQLSTAIFTQKTKKSQQCFRPAVRTDPQQAFPAFIDLPSFGLNRGDRLVFVTFLPLHFVDTDGLDVIQAAMR